MGMKRIPIGMRLPESLILTMDKIAEQTSRSRTALAEYWIARCAEDGMYIPGASLQLLEDARNAAGKDGMPVDEWVKLAIREKIISSENRRKA